MKVVPILRETRDCVARVGSERVRRASRVSGRCGAAALDFGDVRVAGQLVTIPLCRAHFRMLRDSPDPRELASAWAPDASLLLSHSTGVCEPPGNAMTSRSSRASQRGAT